jgi:hypothetical protein
MLKHGRTYAAFTAVAFCATAGWSATVQRPPAFHAPFDGSLTAHAAAGKAEPVIAEGLAFEPGLKGQAVRFDAAARPRLAYAFDKNLSARQGAVSFWFRPDWGDTPALSRFLFAFDCPWGASRLGTGAIFLWSWQGAPRADRSPLADTYLVAPMRFETGVWHHIAYVWDEKRAALYFDGRVFRDAPKGHVFLDAHTPGINRARTFDTFVVGGCLGGRAADGLIDDLQIFAEPLTEDEVLALRAEFAALDVWSAPAYFLAGAEGSLSVTVSNRSAVARAAEWSAAGRSGTLAVPAHGAAAVSLASATLPAGRMAVRVTAPGTFAAETEAWGLRRENPLVIPSGSKLDMRLAERVTLDRLPPPERFVTTGEQAFRELDGRTYLETGTKRGSRFAVRFHLPEKAALCCFEWDYPDDAYRIADIIVQPVNAGSESLKQHGESDIHDYQLQVGYLTGDEYPNQNRMLTARCLYWVNTRDVAVVFAALKDNAPAAVAEIRLYEVTGGLPEAGVRSPEPIGGWTRSLALYYEDPAIAYGFATDSLMPGFEVLIDRTAAYMRYTGQDLFVYPGVWYHGLIGPGYNPRPRTPHADRYLDAWMTKFDAQGLGVMPSFNIFDVPALKGLRTDVTVTNGSLHATCAMVLDSGTVSFKASHGRAPDVNVLHPDAQAAVMGYVDELIARGWSHPSFKGLDFRLSEHCCLWLGNLYAGYNDYAVDGFEKATGIRVPVDRADPLRGKAYAAWLMANAREAWVDWRCREIARFYKQIAARLAAARPELRLVLTLLTPLNHRGESSYADPHFVNMQNKHAGIDTALFADTPNIVISQGFRPMRYRAGYDRHRPNYDENFFRNVFYTRGYYESLGNVGTPWLHHHDHYWETSFGDPQRQGRTVPPLSAPWFREHPWRVTTINPAGHHAMKQYVAPLRHHDILGITRGGFLVGTYGVEALLIPFAKAFRALPAQRFDDVPGSTETVKARVLACEDGMWFYVVNTGGMPATATFTLRADNVIDLVTGARPAELTARALSLRLAPYQLRSFRMAARPPGQPPFTVKVAE